MAVSKSAAKLLGLQTAEQLANCFASNCCLPGDQFKMFWSAVEADSKESTTYMFEILKKLLDDGTAQNTSLVEALVNSVHFGIVYMAFSSSDGRIGRFMKKYQSEEEKSAFLKTCPSAKDVMRILGLTVDKQDVIGPNMIACSTLHSAEEFQLMGDVTKCPTLDPNVVKAASLCFHYHHLRALAGEEEKRIAIIQNVLAKLQTLTQQMKMKPVLAKTSLLALLFVLRQLMAFNSLSDRELLRKVASVVQQFYLWPNPYGGVARSVLNAVHNELMSPGANLIEALTAEAYTAEYGSVLVDNMKTKALHYLCNSDSPFAQQYSKVMELRLPTMMEKQRRASLSNKAKKIITNQLSPSIMAMIILKLLADDSQGGALELALIQKLTEGQVAQLYGMVEILLKELPAMNSPEQAADHRSKSLAKIKGELTKLSGGGGTGKTVTLPADLEAPFLPRLPAFSHIASDCKVSYLMDTREVIKMMCLEYMTYPTTMTYEELDAILSGFATAPKPCEIRLVVAGDDAATHSFLCAYMRALQTNPQWLAGISIKLYLLPWGRNHVASWLARHDSWYNRHVYAPFRSPLFLVPFVAANQGESGIVDNSSKEDPVNRPGQFFRDTVELYVREANHTVDIAVYQLEGWLEESKGGGQNEKDKKLEALPDHKIPFMQRMDIGQLADAEAYRVKRKLPEDTPIEEILARKDFAFAAPDVDFTFTKMDLAGQTLRTVTEEGMGFNSILVSNVPRVGDPCFPANPLAPWLEMFVSAQAPKTGKRSVLMSDPKQHISGLEITCNNPAAKFSVLLDGQVFGPYHHIKVSIAPKPSAESTPGTGGAAASSSSSPSNAGVPQGDAEVPFKLSFQTFFPLDF